MRYNPNLNRRSFGAVVALIDQITMPSVLLTAALIRERERGTVAHLLVMPVTPFQIMTSKIWSMELVVLLPRQWHLSIAGWNLYWRYPTRDEHELLGQLVYPRGYPYGFLAAQ